MSRDEKNVAVRCPICDPKDPNKKKLIIRTTDDVTHCWVCGWSSRSLLPLIKKFGSRDQLKRYAESLGLREKISLDDQPTVKKLDAPEDVCLLACHDSFNPDASAVLKYLKSRGVSEKDLWYYRLAFSNEPKWNRRVIFLSYDNSGNMNYVTARAVDRDKQPKYVNCDVERTTVVFNEHNISWDIPLVLCEGPFDLIHCGENATCLLGSELSESSLLFDRIISNSTPVIVALDSDTHKIKRPKLIKKLVEYDIEVKVVDIGDYSDPGSAPVDFMLKAINDAKPVDWMFNFSNKLSFIM